MWFQVKASADAKDKHTGDVNTLVHYKGRLYSGGDDGKIKSWKEDMKKMSEVQAHQARICCLAILGDQLYSCSNDGTIKAWSMGDLKEKGTIFTLEGTEIHRLFAINGSLYSADAQGVVREHEGSTVKNSYNLEAPIKDLLVDNNFLFTVKDLDIVITDIKDPENAVPHKTLEGRAPLSISGEYICFPSRTGTDLTVRENCKESSFKLIEEVKDAHEMTINAISGSLISPFLYTAGCDKTVKQWKVQNDSCEPINDCEADMEVKALAVGDKGEVYAGGSDGQISKIDEL